MLLVAWCPPLQCCHRSPPHYRDTATVAAAVCGAKRRSSIVARNQFSIGHILITFNVHLPTPLLPAPPLSVGPISSLISTSTPPTINDDDDDRFTARTLMQVQPAQVGSLRWALLYARTMRWWCGRLMMRADDGDDDVFGVVCPCRGVDVDGATTATVVWGWKRQFKRA